MALILRGDLFWVDLPNAHTIGEEQRTESDTDRIWVVVSSPAVHVQNGIVIAVPLTTKTHRARGAEAYRIEVYADEISPKSPSYQPPPRGPLLALTEQVRVLAQERLTGDAVGDIASVAMSRIEAGLAFAIGLP